MNILQKHQANLQRLRSKIKSICAGAMFMGTLLLAQDAQAQNFVFDTARVNPFGLTNIPMVSTASLGDLDNDGDLDLLSGEFNYGVNASFFYYENTGTNLAPSFAAARPNPFGLNAQPTIGTPRLIDLDADGDLDIMAGTFTGAFNYYENTGTNSAPAFGSAQTNPFGLANTSGSVNTVDFADLDNDGDIDLLVSDYYGIWQYYQNTGTNTAPAFAAVQVNPFNLATNPSGDDIRPSFFDADADGDQDIMWGGIDNSFHYQENTGTNTAPNFAAEIINPFGLDNLPSSLIYPSFADLDADGDLDLFTGAYDGAFYYYQNNACLLNPTIAANMDTLRVTANATATYQWLDCTNNMPVAGQTSANFVPNLSGNFAVVATNSINNCMDTSACFSFIYSSINKTTENSTIIFPNPAQDMITVQTAQAWQNATIRLVNLNGQVISQQQNVNGNQISLDLKNLPKAIYFIEIEMNNSVSHHKISKQ